MQMEVKLFVKFHLIVLLKIYKNKTSIDLKDCVFMYNNKKIDINSQIKIKEFFPYGNNPKVYVFRLK